MKRILSLLLCMMLLLGAVCTAHGEEPRVFVDSCGRTVTLPREITSVVVTGTIAQIVVFALAPECLKGLSAAWENGAEAYIPEAYLSLPVVGQLYGGKSQVNPETVLCLSPDVIIDVGEAKKTIVEDMDQLQSQIGIPCVHIESTLATLGDTFRALGELLGKEAEAETLAEYCETSYAQMRELSEKVEKTGLLYVLGADGVNVIAKGSYHAEVIDLLCNNLAVVDTPSSKGTGNQVDMEQILLWNPAYVIFAPDSVYDTVATDETWQGVDAIRNGNYAEVPVGLYNWLGFPPAAQRLLGMKWMAKLLYPDAADYDLYEEAAMYYRLFCHSELSRAQYDALVANSLGR